jgi:membrane protein required for colicin V production
VIWVDYVIAGIMAFSALISILRGFIREVLSLIGWVAAVVFARLGMEPVADLLVDRIAAPSIRLGVGFVLVFVGTLLVVGVVNFLVGRLISSTGLTGTDRMLGVLFGFARGALIVVVMVMLAGMTPLPKDPWWRASVLLPYFQELALWLRAQLPEDIASLITYS